MNKNKFLGDEVIYLDPHTTQRSGTVENKINEEEIEMDATYHCKSASRIPITGMDPSVALVSILLYNFRLELNVKIFEYLNMSILFFWIHKT